MMLEHDGASSRDEEREYLSNSCTDINPNPLTSAAKSHQSSHMTSYRPILVKWKQLQVNHKAKPLVIQTTHPYPEHIPLVLLECYR